MLQERPQDRPYAIAFGLLAPTVGILAGGAPLPMVALGASFALLYLLGERQGWLQGKPEGRSRRDYAVNGVFSALVLLFVFLTGGAKSPLTCALYLPVLLASLCYGMSVGLATSTLMVAAAAFFAAHGTLPHTALPARVMAIGLSFPVIAVFGGALRAQMQSRLRALDSEKKDISAMLDLSQMMEAAFDLDMTLNLILLNVQQHCDCRVCAVYLKGADGQTMELRAASGPRDKITLLPAFPVQEALGELWAEAGIRPEEVQSHPASGPDEPRSGRVLAEIDPGTAAFVCLPLAGVEGLLGLLYVGFATAAALTPEARQRLEQIAAYAAFPLQRVLLQHDFRTLAYSDPMTGLDNFRQFEETLADEMARAERYDRPLSLIMLDIDHFKSFNDTLGHPAGDALLGQMGIVLRNSLRNVDRPARYGGEEFVVICPETGAEEAHLIAERIRRSVADTAFALGEKAAEHNAGKDSARVTVSLGCATYPGDAHTARDLVKKADMALYDAKAAGRNTVCAYEREKILLKTA